MMTIKPFPHSLLRLAGAGLLFLAAALPLSAGAPGAHSATFAEASAKAKAEGKAILMVFTGKNSSGEFWCPPCRALDKSVFQSAEFQSWAARSVIVLEMDFPRDDWPSDTVRDHNLGLLEKYGVEYFPTVLITDAAGNVLGTNPSRESQQAWLADAASFAAKAPRG